MKKYTTLNITGGELKIWEVSDYGRQKYNKDLPLTIESLEQVELCGLNITTFEMLELAKNYGVELDIDTNETYVIENLKKVIGFILENGTKKVEELELTLDDETTAYESDIKSYCATNGIGGSIIAKFWSKYGKVRVYLNDVNGSSVGFVEL